MMNNGSGPNGASFQDSRSNSSEAYLQRAASAVEAGDSILGIHLYLAAYERALQEGLVPSEEALAGMNEAWNLAVDAKQRSLAEYIFEKLEPFWEPDEVAQRADELQRLAFDKLEEYGFDRDVIEDMADMVNQDLFNAAPDILCHYEGVEPENASDPEPEAASDSESDAEPAVNLADPLELIKASLAQGKAAVEAASSEGASVAQGMQQRFDYRSLVGFDRAVASMGKLGIGLSREPEFARFVEMLNMRHGLPGIPATGTLVFRSPAREDANYFMVATVGELGLPAIRLRLDRNALGQVVLCVMASPDFKSRLSGIGHGGFESPTAVVLEDLDLWDLPLFDGAPVDAQGLFQMQLSRGAREALMLIQTALSSPEATVLISATEPDDIEPCFWDLIGPYRMVDIDLPDEAERRAVWRSVQADHPSLRGLDVNRMVEFSRTLSRFEIAAIANEAVEDAYRDSLASREFCSVRTDDILARLANFQPLESDEYRRMEDMAVEALRAETSDFDDLLKG